MPNDIEQLSAQREALFAQLRSIDRLRRGTLSSQIYTRKQGDQVVTRGPYYILQGFRKGKKFNYRIPADKAPEVQKHVDNYKHFQELVGQCVDLTDQITQVDEGLADGKKNSRSRKSGRKSSGRRKRS